MTLADPSTSENYDTNATVPVVFYPSVDGIYLTDVPDKVIKRGNIHKNIDVILGNTGTEGYMITSMLVPKFHDPDFNMTDFAMFVGMILGMHNPKMDDKSFEKAYAEVFKVYSTSPSSADLKRDLADLNGDLLLTYPTYQTAVDFSGKAAMMINHQLIYNSVQINY